MKSTLILAFVFLLLGVQTSRAQVPRNHTLRKAMKINVPKSSPTPSGYTFSRDWCLIFPSNKRHIPLRSNLSVVSPDSNFLVIYEAYPIFTIKDSIELAEGNANGFYSDRSNGTFNITPDFSHIRRIDWCLEVNQDTSRFTYDSAYFHYTHKEARRMFNADSVIRIPLDFHKIYDTHTYVDPDNPSYRDRGFNHMEAYIITRKGRGFVTFYCFMNDEGRKDFPKHFKELQKMFRYKNVPTVPKGQIPRDSILRKAMKISVSRYKPTPPGYTFNRDWYTSPSPSRLMNNLSVTAPDSNFIAVCEALEIFTRQDSVWTVELNREISKASNETLHISPDYSHIRSIERCLRRFTRDSAYFYYTHKEAREMFNADSVIRIPLDFKKLYGDGDDFIIDPAHHAFRNRGFNHVEVFIITRKGRGYVTFYCFMNDQGRKDFDKHFKALQRIFRYKND